MARDRDPAPDARARRPPLPPFAPSPSSGAPSRTPTDGAPVQRRSRPFCLPGAGESPTAREHAPAPNEGVSLGPDVMDGAPSEVGAADTPAALGAEFQTPAPAMAPLPGAAGDAWLTDEEWARGEDPAAAWTPEPALPAAPVVAAAPSLEEVDAELACAEGRPCEPFLLAGEPRESEPPSDEPPSDEPPSAALAAPGEASAERAAVVLEQLATRLRSGSLVIPAGAPSAGHAATLASILAALLDERVTV